MNKLTNVSLLILLYIGALFGSAALMLLGENETIGLYGLPIIVVVLLVKNAYTRYFSNISPEMELAFHKFNSHVYVMMLLFGCLVVFNIINEPKYPTIPSFLEANVLDRTRLQSSYEDHLQKLKTLKIISAVILLSPFVIVKIRKSLNSEFWV